MPQGPPPGRIALSVFDETGHVSDKMIAMTDGYGGPFDPEAQLAMLSRRALASLGREYMLFGHLLNRAALGYVHMKLGAEAREAVAIEECSICRAAAASQWHRSRYPGR